MKVKESTSFSFRNEAESAPRVRAFVSRWLEDLPLDSETRFEVLLAVGEALANVCQHACQRRDGFIRVQCSHDAANLSISVADDGEGFDPAAVPSDRVPDLEAAGGRGVFLMHRYVDEVDIDSSSRGTTVTLVRAVPDRE